MHIHGSCNDWVSDVALLSVKRACDTYGEPLDDARKEQEVEDTGW